MRLAQDPVSPIEGINAALAFPDSLLNSAPG
jgi:hypothetical protein